MIFTVDILKVILEPHGYKVSSINTRPNTVYIGITGWNHRGFMAVDDMNWNSIQMDIKHYLETYKGIDLIYAAVEDVGGRLRTYVRNERINSI